MEIKNLSFGDNNIKNVGANKTSSKTREKKTGTVDSVNISSSSTPASKAETTAYVAETSFEPRLDKVQLAVERVERGEYNDRFIRSVAESVVESPAVTDLLAEVAMNSVDGNNERSEMLENVRAQVEDGYYDQPAMREQVAQSLIRALGLDKTIDG